MVAWVVDCFMIHMCTAQTPINVFCSILQVLRRKERLKSKSCFSNTNSSSKFFAQYKNNWCFSHSFFDWRSRLFSKIFVWQKPTYVRKCIWLTMKALIKKNLLQKPSKTGKNTAQFFCSWNHHLLPIFFSKLFLKIFVWQKLS